MTGPRIPMLQRKPGVGGPPVPGGSPKMPPLPLPSAGMEGDANAQAAAMAMDASPTSAARAPDEPSGIGMTQCPVCGSEFDPTNPQATATPPAGAGAGGPPMGPPGAPPGMGGPPGAGAGGAMPPGLGAKLAAIMGGGGMGAGGGPR